MKTILFPCPKCKQQHAMYWLNRKKSRQLGVVCDLDSTPVFVAIPKAKVDVMDIPQGLPEYFTPEAKKKAAMAGQGQLSMALVKDGEQVERAMSSHQVDEVKTKIDAILKECSEIDKAIIRLQTRYNERRATLKELGRTLSELQTEPLKLSA